MKNAQYHLHFDHEAKHQQAVLSAPMLKQGTLFTIMSFHVNFVIIFRWVDQLIQIPGIQRDSARAIVKE